MIAVLYSSLLAATMPSPAERPNLCVRSIGASTQDPANRASDPAVRVTNGLAVDLYRRLATEAPGQNLFCSPLSVAMALAMVAEGARDETLAEMRRVLCVPDDVRLDDVHRAFAALEERYRAGGGGADAVRLRVQIEALRAELAAANDEAAKLQDERNWPAMRAAAERASAVAAELNRLLPLVDRYELALANALWVERTFPLLPSFVDALAAPYGTGSAQPLDFVRDAEGARRRINGWVAEHTRDRIRDLIPRNGVSPDTSLVVTNAVWFRGEWEQPFDVRATRDEDFQLPGGGRVTTPMMRDRWRDSVRYAAFDDSGAWFATPAMVPADEHARQPATYPGDTGFTMVELRYKGGELAMVVLAPRSPDGLGLVESLLTPERLEQWCARLAKRTVDTALPRFELDARFELGSTLRAMGMQRAFVSPGSPGAAQFGGISDSSDPRRQVSIGAVHHRAWLSVEEKGTEAAAATAVMLECGAAAPSVREVPFVPVFRADRPFLFVIRDVKSGAVLFVGRVVSPAV